MRRRRFFDALTVALLATLMIGHSSAFAQGNSNKPPKDDGGGGTTAPARYALQRFEMPVGYGWGAARVEEINNLGEVVGYCDDLASGYELAFYYDSFSDDVIATDLNDLTFDPVFPVPSGWRIDAALGINDAGDISGALMMDQAPYYLRGCVIELRPTHDLSGVPLDPAEEPLPRLHLLPDEQWTQLYTPDTSQHLQSYAVRINDDGLVLGRGDNDTAYIYRPALHGFAGDVSVQILPWQFDAFNAYLNNSLGSRPPQVFSRFPQALYTVGDATPQFLNLDVRTTMGLSLNGAICGTRQSTIKVRGQYPYQGYYWQDGVFTDFPNFNTAYDVNATYDVLGHDPLILDHSEYGALDINSTIVAESDAELQLWMNNGQLPWRMSERSIEATEPADKYPLLTGRLRRYDLESSMNVSMFLDAFVLVPIPAL